MGIRDALRHAWNMFVNDEKTRTSNWDNGPSYGVRADRIRMRSSNERTIIASIYNRIGIDVGAVTMLHVRNDQNGRYKETLYSGLNNCLTLEANIDQAATAFRQDATMTMLEKGTVAIVPINTTLDPNITGSYDILDMRLGEILDWFPRKVRVRVYDETDGKKKDMIIDKSITGLIENPLYSVMNEPNSTIQRLVRKLNQLDAIDEQISSGKLDLIVQLPFVIKSETRRAQAEQRRKDIEVQLSGSKYGIAYTDGTEKITQLNRPAENNLLAQVEYLTKMLYGQLGITEEVLNGTADEQTMLNYYSRTIKPILTAYKEEFMRKFLTKTARSQGQALMFFRDSFALMPIKDLAAAVDQFMRNEVITANEVRPYLGLMPSSNPSADELRNKNMPVTPDQGGQSAPVPPTEGDPQNGTV